MPSHPRRCCSDEALSSRRAAWQLLELPAAASLRTARSPRAGVVLLEPPVGEDRSEGKQNMSRSPSEGLRKYVTNLICNEAFSELHPQPFPREESRLQTVPTPECRYRPFCAEQHFTFVRVPSGKRLKAAVAGSLGSKLALGHAGCCGLEVWELSEV